MEPVAWGIGSAVAALTIFEWIPVNYSQRNPRYKTVEVYGPVWFTLYILMAIAFAYWWLSSVSSLDIHRHRAVWIVYFVSLFFNKIWSFLFFGMRSSRGLVLAAVDAFLILATAVAEVVLFHCDSAPVITLVLWYIYIAWLLFAFGLSVSIAANRGKIFRLYSK
jgi:tryptophan-rich sensory protein